MRGFGRSCRGHGHVFVKRVRHTERPLLALGEPIMLLAHKATERLEQTATLEDPTRERLTQGKKLSHGKLVNAYDPTIAPMVKGKSNCPAQFGRKPGMVSEPTTGFIFATLVPNGHPSDSSSVLPLLDKVHGAMERVQTGPRRHIHALAGDRSLNDPLLRQALHARGILTVGIPKTIEPIATTPSAQEVLNILNEAG